MPIDTGDVMHKDFKINELDKLETGPARGCLLLAAAAAVLMILGLSLVSCTRASSSSDVAANGSGNSSASSVLDTATPSRSGVTVSPTVVATVRTFCEAHASYTNTYVSYEVEPGSGDQQVSATDAAAASKQMTDAFSALAEMAPVEIHADMTRLADSTNATPDTATLNRVDSWLARHCGFTMSGLNLPNGPGTTPVPGITMTTAL